MMDVDSSSLPPRLPGRVTTTTTTGNSNATATIELSAASRSSFLAGKMLRGADVVQSRPYGKDDATSSRHSHTVAINALGGRDSMASHVADGLQQTVPGTDRGHDRESAGESHVRDQPQQQMPSLKSNSQDTETTNDTVDAVFTPTASAGGLSRTNSKGSVQDASSQESQLLQLSQIAATREKIPNPADSGDNGPSRKRMADGMVKSLSEGATASPALRGGHSRNTSTVSVASSTGSRLGEISAELKTRLSYAMLKVNNGWQSHSIDQVETLASQAASPTSSNSTLHFRRGASASPQISTPSYRGSNSATPITAVQLQPTLPRSQPPSTSLSSSAPSKPAPVLAPPITIEPSQNTTNPRRTTAERPTPSLAGHHHLASPNTTPHTPGQPSPLPGPEQRTPAVDPMVFSPHQTPQQNVREQDAMEALLFMSSPGNSANLKHTFPSSSQPLNRTRTALPGSQPRKSLPSGRPVQNPVPHPYGPNPQPKRGAFDGAAGPMDVDDPAASPYSRGAAPKRKAVNGVDPGGYSEVTRNATPARLKQLPLSSGLSGPSRPRPRLEDADIDRMLDSVAAAGDSSDSEGEIVIPARPPRREEVVAAAR